ncbi:hypothetical protein C7M84_024912 [Penaeus vannamei]|uniref:Uncharacterized protein n=1 Tax=Penaeus vannamei TaxID=6689 RepID=A0A3R7PZD2_PENVA|nr:uncharacterized protein LOC113802022 [Penaeus vannamei]ROT81925.1 hypothetical protein C7M84_024912 [Penaeus vannamei]
MRPKSWWWLWAAAVVSVCGVGSPGQAFTLEGYFKVLALAAKKRDVWRKIFLGKDLGFDVSPWLFKDRVRPPYVPVLTSFPRSPFFGHYTSERNPAPSSPASSSYTFYDGQVSMPNARRHYTYPEARRGWGAGGGGGGGWLKGMAAFQGLQRNGVVGQNYFGGSAEGSPMHIRHRRDTTAALEGEEGRRRRRAASRGGAREAPQARSRFQVFTYLGYEGLPER